jgi:amino acid transporter
MTERLHKADLKVVTVFFMIFILCSSGAYGIEDMVSSSGPGMTLLFLLFLPFLWSIPMGLICAEMGSAIPEEGGFYKWVQRGLGEFWGFQAGWWQFLSILVDSTVYVVLAVSYINTWFELTPLQSWLLSIFFIAIFTYMNIRGIEVVAFSSVVFALVILTPFLIMVVVGLFRWQYNPFVPIIPDGQSFLESMGLGLAIAMWQYSGYESISTLAGEMKNPQRVIPRALLLAMPFIMAVYILPTLVGLASVGDWANWSTEGFSYIQIGAALIGPVFGVLFLISAVVSQVALYNNFLATGTRAPFAMADDKLLPPFLSKLHPKYKTPYIAILIMAGVNAILCGYGFETLIVIDVFLLMFAYILIFISAIALRIKEPDMPRPFRAPVNTAGLIAISVCPIAIAVLALFTNGVEYIIGGLIGAASGPIAYFIFKKAYGGIKARPQADLEGAES